MEFTHYYGKHKNRNNTVRQIDVRQKNRITVRFTDETVKKISEMLGRGQTISGFIRTRIENQIKSLEQKEWEEETAEW